MCQTAAWRMLIIHRQSSRTSAVTGRNGPSFPLHCIFHYRPLLFQVEFDWTATYGRVIRVRAPLGVRHSSFLLSSPLKPNLFQDDVLLISDPKALQHICQTAGYRYPKNKERKALGRLLTGPGLTWADGVWLLDLRFLTR